MWAVRPHSLDQRVGGRRGPVREHLSPQHRGPGWFWAEAAEAIDWSRSPRKVVDLTNPPFTRWFPDSELNTCYNAVDRHIQAGRGDQTALIYDSPVTNSQRSYTYVQLRDGVPALPACSQDSVWARATAW